MTLYLQDPYYFSLLIGSVVLLAQIAGIITILLMCTSSVKKSSWLQMLAKRSVPLAFIVTLTAVASSLLYSDVFNMSPCKLCWYQRIFIFPQFIILGIAVWKGFTQEIRSYCIALACIALPISIYHYALQTIDAPAIHSFAPCDVTGQAPSCSGYYVRMYDYITIPLMALTSSVLVLVLMLLGKHGKN